MHFRSAPQAIGHGMMSFLNALIFLFSDLDLLPGVEGDFEIQHELVVLLGVVGGLFHLLGIVSSFHAILTARSSEAAVAWRF